MSGLIRCRGRSVARAAMSWWYSWLPRLLVEVGCELRAVTGVAWPIVQPPLLPNISTVCSPWLSSCLLSSSLPVLLLLLQSHHHHHRCHCHPIAIVMFVFLSQAPLISLSGAITASTPPSRPPNNTIPTTTPYRQEYSDKTPTETKTTPPREERRKKKRKERQQLCNNSCNNMRPGRRATYG